MKKTARIIILLALLGFPLYGQSVWTGNAAAGSLTDFPGESDTYRGASNSFPTGTRLQVSNPRNGLSLEVVVIGRLETPGVFLLLEPDAAEAIDLPLDQVLSVRVTPLSNPYSTQVEADPGDESEITDPDYNPTANLDDFGELRSITIPTVDGENEVGDTETDLVEPTADNAMLAESPSELNDTVEDFPGEMATAPDVVHPESEPEDTEVAPIVDEVIADVEIIVPGLNPEMIYTYVVDEPEPEVALNPEDDREDLEVDEVPLEIGNTVEELSFPESPIGEHGLIDDPDAVDIPTDESSIEEVSTVEDESPVEELPPSSDTVTYFLTPSDLRPPRSDGLDDHVNTVPEIIEQAETDRVAEEPDDGDSVEVVKKDFEESSTQEVVERTPSVEQPIPAPVLTRDPRRRYIQIGAFRNPILATASVETLQRLYPLGFFRDVLEDGRVLYRLVIGPLSPAETGSLVRNLRALGYADAFVLTSP